MEVSENVCKDNFEEYAQATWKKNGKPTIIRLQTHTGNMNPDMGKVDIVPDDDLNKNLKFHVGSFSFEFHLLIQSSPFERIEPTLNSSYILKILAYFNVFQQRNFVEVVSRK